MTLYVLTYDERARHQHDYQRLYDLLKSWNAVHLQNSVWLADMNGTAAQVRDAMKTHMHPDDTVCVVQIPASGTNWATIHARPEGKAWLKAHFP